MCNDVVQLVEHATDKHFSVLGFNCKLCGTDREYDSKWFQKHMLLVHGLSRPYSCPVEGCGWDYSYLNAMKTHLASHCDMYFEPDVYSMCGQCGLAYRNDSDVDHTGRCHKRQYSCPSCPAKLSSDLKVEEHLTTVHKNVVKCSVCNIRFLSKVSCDNHQRINHSELFPFSCPVCARKHRSRGVSPCRPESTRLPRTDGPVHLSNRRSPRRRSRSRRCRCPRSRSPVAHRWTSWGSRAG